MNQSEIKLISAKEARKATIPYAIELVQRKINQAIESGYFSVTYWPLEVDKNLITILRKNGYKAKRIKGKGLSISW